MVADEVRALAHRTQQSTHEIEGMIASVREGTDTAVSAMRENDQRARQMLDEAEAADHAWARSPSTPRGSTSAPW